MGRVKIAMCQIVCLDGDRRGNLARAERAVSEAAAAGAVIACLPESAVLGWVNPDAHRRAQPIPGEDSERLCEMARRHGVFLCAGLDERAGESLYDSAVLVDDAGKVLLKHRKIILLSELMTPPYSAGEEVQVAQTRFGRVGVLICADTHEPRSWRRWPN
jgi:predicted amidohydrolase